MIQHGCLVALIMKFSRNRYDLRSIDILVVCGRAVL